jgi:hypothetical protein
MSIPMASLGVVVRAGMMEEGGDRAPCLRLRGNQAARR